MLSLVRDTVFFLRHILEDVECIDMKLSSRFALNIPQNQAIHCVNLALFAEISWASCIAYQRNAKREQIKSVKGWTL